MPFDGCFRWSAGEIDIESFAPGGSKGKPHRLRKWAEILTVGGAVGAAVGGRNRAVLAASGAALLTGSALQRFGVFEAGVASTRDPRYVVVPQRERLARSGPTRT